MKVLSPTTIGILGSPTRLTATSSAPGVIKPVLLKIRLHPTIIGLLDSPTNSTTPSSNPGMPSVLSKTCLFPTNPGILGGCPSSNIELSLCSTTSSSPTSV
ncbi:hypothetical protein QL285_025005 [Trifolium repens]|nr:hypothetical protein QL285_025005 [Trifolium repens]